MPEAIDKICTKILKKATPTKTERARVEALARKLERKVAIATKEAKIKAYVRLEGSLAKDTWLNEKPDIDIFMRVPVSMPRKSLGDTCLRIARKATKGSKQIERFAEHPYLEAIVNGTRINIVPCYTSKPSEWLSATDRTPYHTDYMKEHLTAKMRGEVRLLKMFMKGISVYGAEIKVGGFSGYLCELLILHYESFLKALKAFANHKRRIVVDIENLYEGREKEISLLFSEPLVMIDPVDKGRNVASAVQPQKLHTFVAASQAFLKTPSQSFFYPPEILPLTAKEFATRIKERGLALVFVTFRQVRTVPDVLWGQLYKSQRSLRKLVQLNDFKTLRDLAWSDEKDLNVFVLELEQCCISAVVKHLGPPLDKEKECEKFLTKYVDSKDTVCGPYLEDGRWVVLVRRRFTDACDLLKERLKDGGRNTGVAEGIAHVLKKGFKVLVNEEIVKFYKRNGEFAVFLTEFLQGRPRWLETHST